MRRLFGLLAGAVALLAAPAYATDFGVTRLVVTSAIPDFLQVAEIEALSSGFNVAAAANGGSASALSSAIPGFTDAGNAINGNFESSYMLAQGYHSAGTSGAEYLQVDFAAANLDVIRIYGRSDCCSARDVYNVAVYAGSNLLETLYLDANNGSHYAAAELVTNHGAPVPEPATWALMLTGFAAIGATLRRTRRHPRLAMA